LLHDLGVGIDRAAGQAVSLAEGREPDHPLMEPFTAVAQRLLERLGRAGDEAVE
jgi:hypothetical protein